MKLIHLTLDRAEAKVVARFLKAHLEEFKGFALLEGVHIQGLPYMAILDDAVEAFAECMPTAEQREAIMVDSRLTEDQKCHALLDCAGVQHSDVIAERIDHLVDELEEFKSELEEISKLEAEQGLLPEDFEEGDEEEDEP